MLLYDMVDAGFTCSPAIVCYEHNTPIMWKPLASRDVHLHMVFISKCKQ